MVLREVWKLQIYETPISVPVGKATLGRIFNVLGVPVDEMGDVSMEKTLTYSQIISSIH